MLRHVVGLYASRTGIAASLLVLISMQAASAFTFGIVPVHKLRRDRHLAEGTACEFTSIRQVLKLNEDVAKCIECTLDTALCNLSCEGCSRHSGSLGPPTTVQLGSCSLEAGDVAVTPDGELICTTTDLSSLTGALDVQVSHKDDYPNAPPSQYTYVLRQPEQPDGAPGPANTLALPYDPNQLALQTGDQLTVYYVGDASGGSRRRLQQDAAACRGSAICLRVVGGQTIATAPGKDMDFYNGKPITLTSVTMIATICGVQPLTTVDDVKRAWFNADQSQPSSASQLVTLQQLYDTCSYSKLSWLPKNNLITTVDIPCKGDYYGTPYDPVNSCDDTALQGIMNDAIIQAQKKLGLSWDALDTYKRRIVVMSGRTKCGWSGLGSIGCPMLCNTYLNLPKSGWGAENIGSGLSFHELGHNIGLNHGNRFKNWVPTEYGDFTDTMGSGGPSSSYPDTSSMCFSAPNSWKAGWSQYTRNVSLTKMGPGQPQTLAVPPVALSDKNFVLLWVSWLPPTYSPWDNSEVLQDHQYTISYRVKQSRPAGFDSALGNSTDQKVYIHNFNATVQNPPRVDPPGLTPTLVSVLSTTAGYNSQAKMDIGTFWRRDFGRLPNSRSPINGITVQPTKLDPTLATFTICYFQVLSEDKVEDGCSNGLDDDCDGVVDGDEPECGGSGITPTPSPPPKSPSPSSRSPPPRPPSPSPRPPPRRPRRPPTPPPRPPSPPKRRKQPPPPQTQ